MVKGAPGPGPPSHGHRHLVVFILTLLVKGWLGIVSIQLEGRVGMTEG